VPDEPGDLLDRHAAVRQQRGPRRSAPSAPAAQPRPNRVLDRRMSKGWQRPGPARRSPPDTPSTPTVPRPPAPHQGRLRRRSAMEHAPPLTRHRRPDDRQLRGHALRLDSPDYRG
jgi:hypothetical protein